VLDCANGYQKEDQKESDEVEESHRHKGNFEERASPKADNSQEIGKEESHREKARGEEHVRQEDYRQKCGARE
jgi:hypothetical protein